jgi:hypothetical protein
MCVGFCGNIHGTLAISDFLDTHKMSDTTHSDKQSSSVHVYSI